MIPFKQWLNESTSIWELRIQRKNKEKEAESLVATFRKKGYILGDVSMEDVEKEYKDDKDVQRYINVQEELENINNEIRKLNSKSS
jgi:DNA-binding winged helix-turn-helix (wHTH) protein